MYRKDISLKVKKTRRGKRKGSKNISKPLRLMGVNSAGLRSKMFTFQKVLDGLKPSVFFIEETKFKDAGKIKVDNYIVFERLRPKRDNGGGVALGCLPELKPAWVREGVDEVEALSVDIFVRNLKIRCCVAYGCQESDVNEKKEAFWKYMDEEVIDATNSGAGLIIHFDGNLWAGGEIIPNDPRPQNRNGKLFEQFLRRNTHLSVVNSLDICEGLITRKRLRNGKLEESVLDFFVVCNLILPHVTRMVIDEENKHVLTNYEQVRKGGKAADSDHATEYLDLDLRVMTEKSKRRELWNFKNKKAQMKFKIQTTETKEFSNCFNNVLSLTKQIENWQKVFNSHVRRSFKKVRIMKNKKAHPLGVSKLIDERNNLLNREDCEKEVEDLNEIISNTEADINRNKILKHFKSLSENPDNVNLNQVWKTMDKIWPKVGSNLPSAKKNHKGRIISEPNELKLLLAKE